MTAGPGLLRVTRQATMRRIALELDARRDALAEQAEAVRAALARGEGLEFSADAVLSLYLVAAGAKDVAGLCNAFGWRLPGAKGGERLWGPKDVFELIRGPSDGLDAQLHGLALEKLEGRHEAQWGPSGRAWQDAHGG